MSKMIWFIKTLKFTGNLIISIAQYWHLLDKIHADTDILFYLYICDTPISDNLCINQALVTTVVKMDTRCVLGTIYLFCFGGFWLCSFFQNRMFRPFRLSWRSTIL